MPERGPRVGIQNNFTMGGLDIYIILDTGKDSVLLLEFGENGYQTMQPHDRMESYTKPSIRLPDEYALELYKALAEHFRLISLSTDRDDLLHERKRREKLEDAITDIAIGNIRHG